MLRFFTLFQTLQPESKGRVLLTAPFVRVAFLSLCFRLWSLRKTVRKRGSLWTSSILPQLAIHGPSKRNNLSHPDREHRKKQRKRLICSEHSPLPYHTIFSSFTAQIIKQIFSCHSFQLQRQKSFLREATTAQSVSRCRLSLTYYPPHSYLRPTQIWDCTTSWHRTLLIRK